MFFLWKPAQRKTKRSRKGTIFWYLLPPNLPKKKNTWCSPRKFKSHKGSPMQSFASYPNGEFYLEKNIMYVQLFVILKDISLFPKNPILPLKSGVILRTYMIYTPLRKNRFIHPSIGGFLLILRVCHISHGRTTKSVHVYPLKPFPGSQVDHKKKNSPLELWIPSPYPLGSMNGISTYK